MAKSKYRTYSVSRTYLVERGGEIRAESLEAAVARLKDMKYEDFAEDRDTTATTDENVFVDWNSSIQRHI